MVGRSILIVDDEAPIREMIAVALEMAGYDCIEAENSQQAHAIIIDRNVLEWRLDPTSPDRLPVASSADIHYILVCNQGYSSSLAAATLRDLGLSRATDLRSGKTPESGPALRGYGIGAQILAALGIHDMVLLTNTTHAPVGLSAYGLAIVEERCIAKE